jgi:hypothetical protein
MGEIPRYPSLRYTDAPSGKVMTMIVPPVVGGAVVPSAAMAAGIPARITQAMTPMIMFRFLYKHVSMGYHTPPDRIECVGEWQKKK